MGNSCACLRHFGKTRESSRGNSSVEEKIERSKVHWSHLAEFGSTKEEVAAKIDNVEVFKSLQLHPTWGRFFRTYGYALRIPGRGSVGLLEVGEKFAEGEQVELFHSHVTWTDLIYNEELKENGIEWVLKVFKKGTLICHLQFQWPHGMFQHHVEKLELFKFGKPQRIRYYSMIHCGILLEDGRFVFLMVKENEDLRSVIDVVSLLSIAEN